MSQENVAVARADTPRPIADRILLRMPFLADFALARLANLPPGSSLRRRVVSWGLRRAFDAIARKDFDVPVLAFEPDVEIRVGAAGLGFKNAYEGHQGWLDFANDFFATFVDARITVKRVLDAGDCWVAHVGYLGQGEVSGAEIGANWGMVYYLSQRGKIGRQDVFWAEDGWSQALEAAGLSE